MKFAFGTVDPPLGNARLSVVKLISALITTNIPEVNSILIQLNTFAVLLVSNISIFSYWYKNVYFQVSQSNNFFKDYFYLKDAK